MLLINFLQCHSIWIYRWYWKIHFLFGQDTEFINQDMSFFLKVKPWNSNCPAKILSLKCTMDGVIVNELIKMIKNLYAKTKSVEIQMLMWTFCWFKTLIDFSMFHLTSAQCIMDDDDTWLFAPFNPTYGSIGRLPLHWSIENEAQRCHTRDNWGIDQWPWDHDEAC